MIQDKKKKILVVLALFFVGLALRLFLLFHTNYTADDSFITYRYAENISFGLGFVYNAGEKVLGTTTPLYTLLLSLLVKTGLDTNSLGKGINILADCLTGVLIFLLLLNFKFSFAFLASSFYLLFPRVMVWSISGMETGLYLFLISSSFYFYERRNFNILPVLLALVWLTRFEGLILIAALSLDYLLMHKRLPLKTIGFTFLLILPWLIFATFYFGSPVPHSIWAKKALYQGTLQTARGTILWEFMILKTQIGWVILVFSILGAYRILKKMKGLRFILIWTFFYLCFYLFSGTRMHIWYYVPFYLGYLILTAQGMAFFYEYLRSVHEKLSKTKKLFLILREMQALMLIFVVALFFLIYWKQTKRTINLIKTEQRVLEQIHMKIGLWFEQNSDEGDTVCAEDIGYMGYFSERYILDQDGLISPQAVPFNRKGSRLGLLRTYLPRYVVLGFYGPFYKEVENSTWFQKNYKLLKKFNLFNSKADELKMSSFELDFHPVPEYAIYERVEIVS
jgi:hypothetical protein